MNQTPNTQDPCGPPTEHRFDLLLGALILFMLATPIVSRVGPLLHPNFGRATLATIFVGMMLATVFAVGRNRRMLLLAAALVAPAVCFELIDLANVPEWISLARHTFNMLFLCFGIVVILKFVFATGYISYNRLCAALCVYLLLGVFWASTYSIVDMITPGSFMSTHTKEHESQTINFGDDGSIYPLYFSFVTMTTLGYGDIVPASPMAKMCAIVEAIIGQLYLTVLIARLVGIHIAQSVSNVRDDGRRFRSDSKS